MPQSRPQSRVSATKPSGGVEGRKKPPSASEGKSAPRVRSVLIEPRDNEPPRVSVSVEYESETPGMKALEKAAMEVCHDVVRRASAEGTLKDLGYRESQTKKTLTQTFSL